MNNPLELLNNSQSGKIVVNSDEWTLSNTGFTEASDTVTFVTNIAKWFTGGRSTGKFHAYSTNFGLTQSVLAETMAKAGYTWTVGKNIKIDLPTLLTFDGIFLSGDLVDNQVLIDYVKAGGNVYLGAGTGSGGPQAEADHWNTFLNAFGFKFVGEYNGISGNQTINSSHPIFAGVKAIYLNSGNSIVDLEPASRSNQVILTHTSGQGLIAAFAGEELPLKTTQSEQTQSWQTVKTTQSWQTVKTTQSEQTQTLWQIGYPGKIGKESLQPAGWQQEVTYVVGSDQDPVNKSSMPFLLVKPGLTPKPERDGKQISSTDKLNIRFLLEQNYDEGELILIYDFFGSETDTLSLDGKNMMRIVGAGEGILKQNQIPLGALNQGEHTLTITTDEGNGSHWIDYLRLLFKKGSKKHPEVEPTKPDQVVPPKPRTSYAFRLVAFKVPNGQYLVAENGGGGSLLANSSQISTCETFRLITLENGKFALKAPLKEEYLSVLPDGNFTWIGHIKEWEMLDLIQLAENKVALKGYHGKYISIQQGGGGIVIANGSAIKEWEILELIELESRKSKQKEKKGKEINSQEGRRKIANTIILEFGSQKKNDIRNFTEGRGRLLRKVARAISELQKAGEIDDGVQPVIAIIRQKKSRKTLWD
jgi:hypothetical protein